MKRVVRTFDSFADAERAEDAYYAALSPAERVAILLKIVAAYREGLGEAAAGFARVHRVVDLEAS